MNIRVITIKKGQFVYWPFFIALILLSVYYFRFNNELCIIDDYGLFKKLSQSQLNNIVSSFIYNAKSGLYYRPLTSLTYKIEYLFFKDNPIFYYFDNLLIFFITILFYYKILRRILNDDFFVFSSLLIFCVNPLAVESVAWISGRTDLLALMFLTIGFYFLFEYALLQKLYYLFLSLTFMLLATLSKETASMFVLAIPLFITSKETLKKIKNKKLIITLSILLVILFLGFFLILREISFVNNSKKIYMTIKFIINNPEFATMKFFRLIGFYIKKLIIPWPLNLTIESVDPLYDLIGVLIVILAIYLFFKNTLINRFFVIGLCFLLPAYPISFGQIAWTPYAERYALISSMFIYPFILFYIVNFVNNRNLYKKIYIFFMSIVIIIFGITSHSRAKIWSNNISLLQDVTNKNPEFQDGWRLLGLAYHLNNDLDKAEKYYLQAKKIGSFVYNYKLDEDLGVLYLQKKQYDLALGYFYNILKHKSGRHKLAKQAIFEVYVKMLINATNSNAQKLLEKRIDLFYEENKKILDDAHILYKLGKYFLNKKNKQYALKYLKIAHQKFKPESRYKNITKSIIKNINKFYN